MGQKDKALAYFVHFYTASGVFFVFLALIAIIQKEYSSAYLWFFIAVFIDATDGTMARKFKVKEVLPHIDGRTLDDIIDFLNFTFLPLVLMWQKNLLPSPSIFWLLLPMLASLFAFANVGIKEEKQGFFVGFPSYWNIFAFYSDVGLYPLGGPYLVLVLLLFFSLLNVLPVRFVYPNLAPRWRGFFIFGTLGWGCLMLYMFALYSKGVPSWLVWFSFVYPFLYLVLSVYLDWDERKKEIASLKQASSN